MRYKSAQEVVSAMVRAYYEKRDVEAILDCVTEDVEWIGTEQYEKAKGKEELRKVVSVDIAPFPETCVVEVTHPKIQDYGNVVMVSIEGRQLKGPREVCGINIRGSVCCVYTDQGWLISNAHTSVPNAEIERYVLQKEVEENRKKEQLLMASIPGGVAIYRLKKDGRVTTDYVSKSLATMCGYEEEEFLAYLKEDARKNLVQEDVPAVMDAVIKCISEGAPINVQYRIYSKDKEEILVRLDANTMENEPLGEDEIAVLYAVHTKVSEKSKRIIEEQQQLRELINRVPSGIGIFELQDDRFYVSYINDAYYRLLGTCREKRKEYQGEYAINAIHPDDREPLKKAIRSIMLGKNGGTILYRARYANEKWKWINLNAVVVDRTIDSVQVYATLSDFDEIIKARKTQEMSKKTMEIALQSAKVLSWRYDYRIDKVIDSGSLGEYYNLGKTFYGIKSTISKTLSEGSRQEYNAMCERLPKGNVESLDLMSNKQEAKGNVWYRVIYTPIFDKHGDYEYHIGIAVDITEQKVREHHFQEQLQMYRISSKDAMVIVRMNLSKNQVVECETTVNSDFREFAIHSDAKSVIQRIKRSTDLAEDSDLIVELNDIKSLMKSYENGTRQLKCRHRIMSDEEKWVRTTFNLLENPFTGDIETIVVIREITDEVRAESVISELLESEYEMILLIDTKTNQLIPFKRKEGKGDETHITNEQLSSMETAKDYIETHAISGAAQEMIQETSLEKIQAELEKAASYQYVYRFAKNGDTQFLRVMYRYMHGEKKIIMCAIRDVTELYQKEKQYVDELASALKEAEAANAAKTDFLSQMSHELRTPLNSVLGGVSLARIKKEKGQDDREELDMVEKSGTYLLNLISDILDVSRIEASKIELHKEWWDPGEILRTIINMMDPLMRQKGLNFIYPNYEEKLGKTEWYVDAQRIQQLVINLLNNSVKFTPKGGTVTLDVQLIKRESNITSNLITVSDTGCGMSKEFVAHIGEAFAQEQNPYSNQTVGTGLGVYIVKKIIEIMGGELSVESELGKGSTFSFTMHNEYRIKEQNQNTSAKDKENIDLTGARILYAEDNHMNQMIIKNLLENRGATVTLANNGAEALQMYQEAEPYTYCAILMDVRMPVMNGLQTTQCIRELDRLDAQSIPIIALSADAIPEIIEQAMDSGCTDYLTKPVDQKKLFRTLDKYK